MAKARQRNPHAQQRENCGYSLHSFKQNAASIAGIFLP
jgi:hypothetical protein